MNRPNAARSDAMDEVPAHLPEDQRKCWQDGCSSWSFPIELGGYGVITVWPNGRAAVSWGEGESFWGQWDGAALELDEGGAVDAQGWPVEAPPEFMDHEVLDALVSGLRAEGQTVIDGDRKVSLTGQGQGEPPDTTTHH